FAQGTDFGIVRGTVTDASGAVIPNAKLTLTDVATNTPRMITVDSAGEYEVTQLKPGAYTLTVSAPGFKTAEITGITVLTGNAVRADARLEVARATETVTVQSEASAVQTDSPTLSSTLDNLQLIEVPRDSRDIYEFLYLNPNIVQATDGDGS